MKKKLLCSAVLAAVVLAAAPVRAQFAKAEPWGDAADFKARADRLQGETAKLPAAAASLETLRQQVGATGAACKNCHDKYRNS